jgi:hypothetical protein
MSGRRGVAMAAKHEVSRLPTIVLVVLCLSASSCPRYHHECLPGMVAEDGGGAYFRRSPDGTGAFIRRDGGGAYIRRDGGGAWIRRDDPWPHACRPGVLAPPVEHGN